MLSQVEDLRGLRRGPIQIACSQALALDFLPSHIAAFQKKHPKVLFDLRVMDHERALAALAAYEVDLALVYRPAMQPTLRVIASIPQRLVVIVRSDHPLAAKKTVRLSECAEYPLILPDETQYLRGILDQMFHEVGVKPAPFIATNSYALMRDLVDDGLGIAIQTQMPGFSTRRHSGVVYVPLRESLARYSMLACCVANSRRLPITANLFVERLVAALERDFGKDRASA